MAACGLDAIVAASPLNIGYFTGHFVWLDGQLREYMLSPGASSRLVFPGFGVFPAEGAPILVVHALFAANAADLPLGSLVPFGELSAGEPAGAWHAHPDAALRGLVSGSHPKQAAQALANALAAQGLERGRIGLESEAIGEETTAQIAELLPHASLRDCTSLIRMIRAVKTDAEIRALEAAAAAAERAATESLTGAAPGVPLGELTQLFRTGLARSGATLDHFVVGRSGVGLTTDPGFGLAEDDVTVVDYGCELDRYYSDSGTTFAMGGLPDVLAAASEHLVSAIERGADALRPERRASEVSAVMSESLAADGVVGYSLPHGHGIGLEARDYPILVPDNGLRIHDECVDEPSDLPLEEGMVVALEVSLHLPLVASMHEERTYVIGPGGGRPLVAYERDGPLRPAERRQERRTAHGRFSEKTEEEGEEHVGS
jgi:Xaa-Pro aminopeptidase